MIASAIIVTWFIMVNLITIVWYNDKVGFDWEIIPGFALGSLLSTLPIFFMCDWLGFI